MGWAMLYLYILVRVCPLRLVIFESGVHPGSSRPPHAMLVDNGQIAIHDLDSESSTPEILNDLLLRRCWLQAARLQPRQGVPPALCLDSGVLSIPKLSQSSRCMDPSFIPDDHMLKRVQTPKPQISLTPPSLSVRSESPTMKRAINPGGGYVTIPGKSPGQRQRAAQERGHCKFSGRAGVRLR